MTLHGYYCRPCDYLTTHKTKFNRHLSTLKHKIASDGIDCCGIIYYDKHRWVNHKKSVKHYQNRSQWAKECFTTENPDIDIDIPRPSSAPPFSNSPRNSPIHEDFHSEYDESNKLEKEDETKSEEQNRSEKL